MKQFITLLLICFTSLSIFAQNPTPNIVISEIYYNAPNAGIDSLEYVEIYNRGTTAINLEGFTFRAAFNDTLPNVELAPNSFYVVTYDDVFYQKATKSTARKWKSGSLSNNGETIQLWSQSGSLVDSVSFRSVAPWPTTANGNGPSIELCDVTANNDNGSNWKAATAQIGYSLTNLNGQSIPMLGTPGKANTVTCSGGGGGTGTFVAKNINVQTNKNINVNINLATQNQLPGNQVTSSALVSQPLNGTANKAAGGGGGATNTIVYMPNAGFVGRDSFEYSMCTANGCDTAKIVINVVEPAPFTAKNIRVQTNKNTNINVNLSQQYQIPNNQITNSAVVTQPNNGTAVKQAGGGGGATNTLTYTPQNGFVGRDSFEYSMCVAGACDTARILIIVIEPNFSASTIGKVTAQSSQIIQQPDSLNRNVEIIGIVHSPNFSTNGLQFTLIDQKYKADGIEAARATKVGGYTLAEGDKLRVRGRIAQNQGINRIVIDTLFKMEGDIKLHEPLSVSSLEESTENMIVKLEGVSIIDSTKWTNTGAPNFFIVEVSPDNGVTKFNVRIDKDITELSNWAAPKGKFDLIGIGYQGQIATGGVIPTQAYMIMPRYIKDFVFSTKANDISLGKFINVYPNPFDNQTFIQIGTALDAIEISDVYGKVIQKINKPTENQLINSENWQTGIYLLKAIKENKQFVTKIVKQ